MDWKSKKLKYWHEKLKYWCKNLKYWRGKVKVEMITPKSEILMGTGEIKKIYFSHIFFLSFFFLFSFLVFVSIFQSLFLFLPNYYATWKVGNIKILNVRKNIRHYCNCTSIGCINEIKKSNAKHINIYVQPLKSWFVQNIHVSLHPYIFLREREKSGIVGYVIVACNELIRFSRQT